MAKLPPLHGATAYTKTALSPTVCARASLHPHSRRTFSTSHSLRDEREDTSQLYSNRGRELREGPRWSSTPPRMAAPFRSKPPVPYNDFQVNSDPDRLDRVYNKVLGNEGDRVLTEEVKWLAVTHKSFDHGRRGYNDRLAFLGRRFIELQTSFALLHRASATDIPPTEDQFGRIPFHHSALQGLDGLTTRSRYVALEKKRMSQLARSYGLDGVMRWKPKKMINLQGSGLDMVMTQGLYAIVGAVALQRGGETVNRVVRERILSPLGLL